MELWIRIGILAVTLGIIPLLAGLLCTTDTEGDTSTGAILESWAKGFILCLGVFQIVAIPCTFTEQSLTRLCAVYLISLLLLCGLALILNWRRIPHMVKSDCSALRHIPWAGILAILVIAFQMYMYVVYMHVDDDDAFYLATSTTSVQTDSLFQVNPYTGEAYRAFPSRYVLSPFPLFIAVLGRVSGVHVAMVAHTLLPPVLLLLTYVVLWMIGYEMFHYDGQKTWLFVLIGAVIPVFLSTTVYMQGSFMLLRIWQGKAVLTAALLPCLLYCGLRILEDHWKKKDWVLLAALMLSCCMVSSMGIMLGAIMLGMLGIVLAILKRDAVLLLKMAMCGIPNLLYSAVYLFVL